MEKYFQREHSNFFHGSFIDLLKLHVYLSFTAVIAQKGSDAWWYMSNEDLLPESYRSEASQFRKGVDTMDVWFDSGESPSLLQSFQIFFSSEKLPA